MVDDDEIIFEGFKIKFGKTYGTEEEHAAKRKNFAQNLKKLKENS